ncbi:g1957 [Coccomyxa viridis]|uniref:mannose-6-phosphate isomerase n=1 Tax=Coccomyxa viridis TaxID=1274662 RepID=A0ABP1FPL8_9CHLO
MLQLRCPAQNYAWGRKAGRNNGKIGSTVAALVEGAGGEVDNEKPYAELWMGTHPSGPATVEGAEGQTLSSWIAANPSALGSVGSLFGSDIPFLFKVLSVETALSIQSHPDKALAERLHAKSPDVYKDSNHKPEMAIAITDFEALCGFVPHQELTEALKSVPELRDLIGDVAASAVETTGSKAALKAAFGILMTAEASKVATAIKAMESRLKAIQKSGERPLTDKEELALRLNKQYPQDVGILSAFFLNLVKLQAGQAIYLAANVPHAYISGELVECMATSDNVIRAGLTPKLRDTAVLCESLTYERGPPAILNGNAVPGRPWTTVYSPPFDEFEVEHVLIPEKARFEGIQTYLPENQGPQIFVVRSGTGQAYLRNPPSDAQSKVLQKTILLKTGSVVFVPAKTPVKLEATDDGLDVWIAAVNPQVFQDGRLLAAKAVEVVERDATSWLLYLAVGLLLTLLWAKYTNNLEPIQKLFNKLLTQGSSVKQPT